MNEIFKNHKAKLVFHQDNLWLIDFRREDGSPYDSMRFYVDTDSSSLHIEGDLGDCIACWHGKNTLQSLSSFMFNSFYFIEKMQCTSNEYKWNYGLALEDLKKESQEWYEEHVGVDATEDDYNDHINNIMDSFLDSCGLTLWSSDARDSYEELFGDIEGVGWYGRRIDERVKLWAEAFDIALTQLGIKKL